MTEPDEPPRAADGVAFATEPAAPRTPAAVDAVLAAAIEVAREAAVSVGGDSVGPHLGVQAEEERVVTHSFAATLPGYRGWHWAVTLGRVARSKKATVDEVVLLPGDAALLAPAWVPWQQRIRAGDLAPRRPARAAGGR